MDYPTFKRILTTFADTPASIDATKGKLICEIRDEMIEATTRLHEGEVMVTEHGEETRATTWLLKRIARMPILADRILMAFAEPEHFISPRGALINQLDDNVVDDSVVGDAAGLTLDMLGQRPGGCSNVLYLTSDAGEGKTTLISHLARLQAEKFKRRETDWLLVPISLGGKPFLRFDDLVVGYLGNQLRFPLFYFEAFIELVKLGSLVPAFDGFEEMFVQSPQGEALSAIGTLMGTLQSSGTVLIAARKAYFEYQDIRTTARLFDSIGTSSVAFSRVKLERWEKAEFLNYCAKRGIENGAEIHARVAERLNDEKHPLLSRAVLVKRLLDVAAESDTLGGLLLKIGNSPNDYFAVFVQTIVEREANEKWINRVGEPHQPLLTVQEHFELLSAIAHEMWSLSTDSLKAEVLDLITELFCESRKLSVEITFQIKERTKQHALIVGTSGVRQTFAFDHEEFKNFFLGNALGNICAKANPGQKIELLGLLRKGSLAPQTVEATLSTIRKSENCGFEKIAVFLQEVASMDGPTSFTHENVARLLIKILHGIECKPTTFTGLTFGADVLRDLMLTNLTFKDCSFGATSLENTTLKNCCFENCHFDRVELDTTTKIISTTLRDGDVVSVLPASKEDAVFDPELISVVLKMAGFQLPTESNQKKTTIHRQENPDVKMLRRLLRTFQYRTHINEHVILRKLGLGAEMFLKNILPKLVKANILSAEWIPRDKQWRYHVTISMESLHETMRKANASIDDIIADVNRNPD
jgi:NTP pyrophosphatase (non-canonical NTP hydrolase)